MFDGQLYSLRVQFLALAPYQNCTLFTAANVCAPRMAEDA
jgi:hypothetical protein